VIDHARSATFGISVAAAALVVGGSESSISAIRSALGGASNLIVVGLASGLVLAVLLWRFGSATLNRASRDIP
jgi:hypothetical protein